MSSQPVDFSLPNVATGPDPFSLSALSDDVDLVVLYFQRDYGKLRRKPRRERRG